MARASCALIFGRTWAALEEMELLGRRKLHHLHPRRGGAGRRRKNGPRSDRRRRLASDLVWSFCVNYTAHILSHNKILRAVINVTVCTHLMPTPANPSPRRYSSSGGHSRRKMNALTFSCIRQPSSSCSPAPGESSPRRCSSQSRWASRGCFTRRRTSRYAAMDTHRPWSGALLTLEGGRPCLEGPRAG